jgi:hypothetical protein
MDTPPWYYRWIYRMPGLHEVRKTTLEFCGIKPIKPSRSGRFSGQRSATADLARQVHAIAAH